LKAVNYDFFYDSVLGEIAGLINSSFLFVSIVSSFCYSKGELQIIFWLSVGALGLVSYNIYYLYLIKYN